MQIDDVEQNKETGRIEAFSDGVFAIAITLLVLDIKVPRELPAGARLLDALLAQWPAYFAFVTSFATIGIMWINHHRLFTFNLLWRYASYKNRLLDPRSDPLAIQGISGQYAFGPLFYLLAFGLAFVSAVASLAMNMLLALFFALPARRPRSTTNADSASRLRK